MGLRLAVIGDLHYAAQANDAPAYRRNRDAFYAALLRRFFAHPADLHIALGDVTHSGAVEEWEGIGALARESAAAGRRDFRLILGNHDTLAQPRAAVLAQAGARRYGAREWPDCRAVFLDTTREMSPHDYSGIVDDEQLDWLRALAGSGQKPTLVFGHHPFPRTTAMSDRPMMHLESAPRLAERLAPLGAPLIYFNGHNHSHSVAGGGPSAERWTFVQSASALCAPSFRTVEVTPEHIHVGTVILADAEVQGLAQAVREAMPGYWHNPEALGAPSDHEVRVALRPLP